MNYLEKILKFFTKYYIIALPLYILAALPSLIGGVGAMGSYAVLMKNLMSLPTDPTRMQDPTQLIGLFSGIAVAAAGTSFIALLLNFLAIPSTYGMINKAFQTGSADLNDFVPALKDNIVKYIIYIIGTIVIWLVFTIAAGVVVLVLGVLTSVIKWLGILLLIIAIICIIIAAIILGVLTSLWFPAMVVDNMEVMAGLRKSIEIAKSCFWTILGIILLVWLLGVVAGAILGLFGIIPVIGSLIVSIVPTVTGFAMTVFFVMIYRDKTREGMQ